MVKEKGVDEYLHASSWRWEKKVKMAEVDVGSAGSG